MPNGDPSFSARKLDEFFGEIIDVLVSFAKKHNLLVDKYYHQMPSWSLRFSHPQGGSASIEVSKVADEDDVVSIGGVWYVDDHDSLTRSLKYADGRRLPRDLNAIDGALEELLLEMLAWRPGDWSQVASDYQWDDLTKEEFEDMRTDLPKPVA